MNQSDTSPITSSYEFDTAQMKAASIPIAALTEELTKLKPQISAPSYLNSLKENEAPPFRIPGRETRPIIVIGTIMTEEDAVLMVAAAEADPVAGLQKFLGNFLVEKKVIPNYALSEKKFLINLLTETVHYSAQRDFDACKLACLLTIYLCSHLYFKWYYWSTPEAVWGYFKELLIRHTIEDSPDGQEVFDPQESYDILTHFHTAYLTNLPLVHLATFGAHRLKFMWPFKTK